MAAIIWNDMRQKLNWFKWSINCMLSKLFLEIKQLFVALTTCPVYNRAYTINSYLTREQNS